MKKQSDLGLLCLLKPFLQATSVQNFRTFTIEVPESKRIIRDFVAYISDINQSVVQSVQTQLWTATEGL